MKKLYSLNSSVFLIALFYASVAFGWGQKGHDVVALIAQRHLSPAAQAAVDSIFEGKSLVYWSNWLDNASHTPQYDYSKTWHYKNIDPQYTFETAPLNPKGDIVKAIKSNIDVLKDAAATLPEKKLALKMVVHLLGDVHQPMHMGRYSDRGGNRHKVKFFKNDTNLHTVWDSNLPETAHKWSHTEWADEIDRLSSAEQEALLSGSIDDWAKETYLIACDIYNTTPEESVISYDYIAGWTPTIEQQFLRGGHRLAYILNNIFGD